MRVSLKDRRSHQIKGYRWLIGGLFFVLLLNFHFIVAVQAEEENKVSPGGDLNWALEEAKERCSAPPEIKESQVLTTADFQRNWTLKEMEELFHSIYRSGRRLPNPLYYDREAGHFVLQRESSWGLHKVKVPDLFVKSVIRHAEVALARDYADFIFFPDMGHSHLLVPNDFHEDVLRRYPVGDQENRNRQLEAFYSNPKVKFLYHTAEHLKIRVERGGDLINDAYTQWRYYTRNPVGSNDGQPNMKVLKTFSSSFNTVDQLEGHRYRDGFGLSSSIAGCIPYRKNGKVYYMDINSNGLKVSSQFMF